MRLNFQASAERIARLEDESGFKSLATSAKKDPAVRLKEIEAGQKRQEQIRELLRAFGKATNGKLLMDRKDFLIELRKLDRECDVYLSAPELKAVISALGERDEKAVICLDRDGRPEPDSDLSDTETVPLKESIEEYFKREVLPHVPDAWIAPLRPRSATKSRLTATSIATSRRARWKSSRRTSRVWKTTS